MRFLNIGSLPLHLLYLTPSLPTKTNKKQNKNLPSICVFPTFKFIAYLESWLLFFRKLTNKVQNIIQKPSKSTTCVFPIFKCIIRILTVLSRKYAVQIFILFSWKFTNYFTKKKSKCITSYILCNSCLFDYIKKCAKTLRGSVVEK